MRARSFGSTDGLGLIAILMGLNTFVYFAFNLMEVWSFRPSVYLMTVYDGMLLVGLAWMVRQRSLKLVAMAMAVSALLFRLAQQAGMTNWIYDLWYSVF